MSAFSIVRQARQIARDSSAARARLEELTAKKSELEEAIRERGTDEAVRYQAKARFNLKNPGERIVVVLPEKKEPPPSEKRWPLWRRITDLWSVIVHSHLPAFR